MDVEFLGSTCGTASVSLRRSGGITVFSVEIVVLLGHRLSRKGKEHYPVSNFYPRVETSKPKKIDMERENATIKMLGIGVALIWS